MSHLHSFSSRCRSRHRSALGTVPGTPGPGARATLACITLAAAVAGLGIIDLFRGDLARAADRTADLSTGDAGSADAPAGRVLFQLDPIAQASFRTDLAATGRTGIAPLDLRTAVLAPTRVVPVFAGSAADARKVSAGLDRIYVLEFARDVAPTEAAALLAGPGVVYAEPDLVHAAHVTWPNDPGVGNQWAHRVPEFPLGWTKDADGDTDIAWDYTTGDPGMTIAILDSGVDLLHEDLVDRIVPGWDFVNGDSDPTDDEGHGTACAGIAAATGNNGIGIAGAIWNARVMPVKVLDSTGNGFSTWIANGIIWAADNGADVISMSLGSDSPSSTIQNATNYAWGEGTILFASTGNDNQSQIGYPAGFPNVMAVGAMSPCFERKSPSSCDGEGWWGSDYGTGLDFLAPGVNIYTTDISGAGGYWVIDYYESFNGTSSACPYAAGAAALVWSYLPHLSNAELRDLLRLSATDMGWDGWDLETGYGHINPASAIQAYSFADATANLGGSANSVAAAWSDVDEDGDADLYVVNDGSANVYYRNDGSTFVAATTGALGSGGADAAAAFGDADGDGDLDLYITRDGTNAYLRNDSGTFVDATVAPLGNADTGLTTSWMDYDNDGDLDLYFANDGTASVILRNDGGVFTDVTALPLGNARPKFGFAWGDYDNDGRMDVYLANEGTNRLLHNDGGGVFTSQSGGLGDPVSSRGAAWGDVDNDGDLDLFVANFDGENRLWISDGAGGFTDIAAGRPLADPRDTRGAFFLDFDNDGWLDLFTANVHGLNQLWRNEAGAFFTSIAVLGPIASNAQSHGAAWADFDRDGDIDWYVANASGANQLIRNDSPARSWLRVRLEGTVSNGAGIGARVRVVAGGRSQIRELTAGNGHRSQDETIAQFGLGDAATVDSLFVSWPSGTIDVITGLGVIDAEITVVEGEGVPVSAPDPVAFVAGSRLGQNQPNPFGRETRIPFRLAEAAEIEIQVYAPDGRRIRNLATGRVPAGDHQITWDRRDDAGHLVPSGVYFYRWNLGSEGGGRRIVVVE